MVKRVKPGGGEPSAQQQALAGQQATSLSSSDQRTLLRLQLSALPLGQLVDKLLDTVRDGVDADSGEVPLAIAAELDALNLSLERKTQAYAHVAERLATEAAAFDELAKHYASKADARRRERKGLMHRLHGEFTRLGLSGLKTPTVTAYLQRNPAAVELTVLTDDEVPDEYCERRPSLTKIAAALKSGVALSFAKLSQSQHLRFK